MPKFSCSFRKQIIPVKFLDCGHALQCVLTPLPVCITHHFQFAYALSTLINMISHPHTYALENASEVFRETTKGSENVLCSCLE
jgi:hypothetical protein